MIAPAYPDSIFIDVAAKLPTAPRLLVELGHLLVSPHTEQSHVVSLLRRDTAIVASLIRMANSAAYSPAEPVGSLERAVAMVGFAEVHRLVGAIAAGQMAEQAFRLYPVTNHQLRQHTLFTAVLLEELAVAAKESHPRTCYTAGLLRSIGMMALERLGDQDPRIPPYKESGEATMEAWERHFWGVTNHEVAEKILRHWRMPHETVGAVRYHQQPGGRHNPVIHLLRLAVAAANDRLATLSGGDEDWSITSENFAKAGLSERRYFETCEKAQRKFEQLRSAVG